MHSLRHLAKRLYLKGFLAGGLGLASWLCAADVAQAQFLVQDFVSGNNQLASASGMNSMAGGSVATASGDNSLAIGYISSAAGNDGSAFGAFSSAFGNSSTAIGRSTIATGVNSTAVGSTAFASGTESSAFGSGAVATGVQSTAIGFASGAGFANSTAIGANVQTTRDNQIALGTATNTYTAAGITSGASRAAQTGPTQVVTSDANGNLATTTPDAFVNSSSTFQSLRNDVSENEEGVAMAIALGGGASILPDGKNFAVSSNWGTFNGSNAMGFSSCARVLDNLYGNTAIGVGTGQGTVGARAGFSFAW